MAYILLFSACNDLGRGASEIQGKETRHRLNGVMHEKKW